jgi:hypothetical protein
MGDKTMNMDDFNRAISEVIARTCERCIKDGMELSATTSFAVPTHGAINARRVTFSYCNMAEKRPVPHTVHSQIINDKKLTGSRKQLANGIYGCIAVKYADMQRIGMIPRKKNGNG